jgi:hypothetical protein
LIRVIDLLFLMKEDDGFVHGLQATDIFGPEADDFGSVLNQLLGDLPSITPEQAAALRDDLEASAHEYGLSAAEIQSLAAEIAPGTAIGLLLVEHVWAIGLSSAVRNAEGRMVAQGFLTQDTLLAIGTELNTIAESEAAIAHADAVRGAAMLDALTTIAEAEALRQAALTEAAATVIGVESFRTAIAAEAVRALIVAGVLEETAALDALVTLVNADLITEAALDEAFSAAAQAAAELATEW